MEMLDWMVVKNAEGKKTFLKVYATNKAFLGKENVTSFLPKNKNKLSMDMLLNNLSAAGKILPC